MAKPVQCHDERGQKWLVFDGDPGWPHVRQLWLWGVREIVLPRSALMSGELEPVSVPDLLSMDVQNPAVAALLRRFVRLRDCTEALRGSIQLHPEHDSREETAVG